MHISEVAKKYQVSVRTLRFYEECGLYNLERDQNNIRVFHDHDIKELELILSLKRLGLKLADIKIILREQPNNYIDILESASKRLEDEIKVNVRMNNTLKYYIEKHRDLNLLAFIEDVSIPQFEKGRDNMSSRMTVNIGQGLVEYAKGDRGSIIDIVKELKKDILTSAGYNLGPIRIRDIKTLEKYTVEITWDEKSIMKTTIRISSHEDVLQQMKTSIERAMTKIINE